MSLLADLLSKVKHRGFKSDVPPSLKHDVLASSERYAARRKVMFLSVLIFAAVASGVGAVYIINLYSKLYETKKPAQQIEKSQKQVVRESPFIPQTAVKLPADITSEPAEKQGAFIQKRKIKRPGAGRPVSQYQKESRKEDIISTSESKEPEFSDVAGDKKRLSNENQLKRDAYISAAQTYESKRDYHNALASYKKALGLDPGNHFISNNISSVLLTLGSYNEAIPHLKNALSIEKDYVPSLINLGIAHAMLGNFQESEGYLANALSIEPSNVHAILNSAILYERRGDNDRAYSFFYKLSQAGNVQGYLGIARIAEKQGKIQDAANIYHEIMSMNCDPENKKFAAERLSQLGR